MVPTVPMVPVAGALSKDSTMLGLREDIEPVAVDPLITIIRICVVVLTAPVADTVKTCPVTCGYSSH